MAKNTDIILGGGNGFYTVSVISKRASAWFNEEVQTEGWQWLGNTLGIDNYNCFATICGALEVSGLNVEGI